MSPDYTVQFLKRDRPLCVGSLPLLVCCALATGCGNARGPEHFSISLLPGHAALESSARRIPAPTQQTRISGRGELLAVLSMWKSLGLREVGTMQILRAVAHLEERPIAMLEYGEVATVNYHVLLVLDEGGCGSAGRVFSAACQFIVRDDTCYLNRTPVRQAVLSSRVMTDLRSHIAEKEHAGTVDVDAMDANSWFITTWRGDRRRTYGVYALPTSPDDIPEWWGPKERALAELGIQLVHLTPIGDDEADGKAGAIQGTQR